MAESNNFNNRGTGVTSRNTTPRRQGRVNTTPPPRTPPDKRLKQVNSSDRRGLRGSERGHGPAREPPRRALNPTEIKFQECGLELPSLILHPHVYRCGVVLKSVKVNPKPNWRALVCPYQRENHVRWQYFKGYAMSNKDILFLFLSPFKKTTYKEIITTGYFES